MAQGKKYTSLVRKTHPTSVEMMVSSIKFINPTRINLIVEVFVGFIISFRAQASSPRKVNAWEIVGYF